MRQWVTIIMPSVSGVCVGEWGEERWEQGPQLCASLSTPTMLNNNRLIKFRKIKLGGSINTSENKVKNLAISEVMKMD